jgi:hypothetical protein
MFRARTFAGLSTTEFAKKLGTTSRSVTGYESGTQDIPEDRWRLFTLLIAHELRDNRAQLVTVVSDNQEMLDVVSEESFVGLNMTDIPGKAIIWSRYTDRTGRLCTHSQVFSINQNKHVIEAAQLWTSRNFERSGLNGDFLQTYRWLTKRALDAEVAHPELRKLKNRISELSHQVDGFGEGSEVERQTALRNLDSAISDLIERISEINRAN